MCADKILNKAESHFVDFLSFVPLNSVDLQGLELLSRELQILPDFKFCNNIYIS